ncbi:DUF748 domain-containing protein [Humisphaera borealis]|uniref:DUF748 domain-containing protein n=1 Tax=Humisphaera borealis TaxID=2807512 RepID=A0A7M2X206_9BACT|nr:DUF748 domain-containing protein [Humisphaera borealis]QOV91472.1 DUF748 domain-containing protein [Humisphaera borealis]
MSESRVDPLDPGEQPEVKPGADSASDAPAPEPVPTPQKPKKKRRTWKRRLWLAFLFLLIVGLVIRIAVQVAFPIVLNKVAAGFGLNAEYSQLRLSMLSGDVGLGRIEFKSQKSGEVFASANYVRATISPLKLLIGRLEVWRVEADGVDLNLTREADGNVNVLGDLLNAPKTVQVEKKVVKEVATSTQIDLTSPAYVEGFRLQHLRVHLTDKSLSPPLKAMVQLDVRVDDVGSSERPTQFYLNLYSDPVLDALTVEGQGRVAGASIDADVRVGLKGLHLRSVAQYLEPLGIRPVAYDLSATASGTVRASPASVMSAVTAIAAATQPKSATQVATSASATRPATPASQPENPAFPANPKPAEYVGGTVKLKNLALLSDGKEAAACDLFEIDLASAKFGVMQLSRVLIDGVRANASRNAEGNIVAAGMELIPVATPATKPSAPVAAAGPAAPATGPAVTAELVPSTARVSLDQLLLKNVSLSFQDQFVPQSEKMSFEVDWLSVNDIVFDAAKPDAQIKIAGAFKSPGVVRAIKLNGTARPFAQKRTLNLALDVSGIEPTILQPYLDFAGLDSTLKDGSFTANLAASATVDPSGKVGAEAVLGGISFQDGDELFGMKNVSFSGIAVNPKNGVMRVEEIEITGPTLAFKREKDGAFSGFGFRTKAATPYPRRKEQPESAPSELKLAKFELGKFTWKDVAVRFDDEAAVPPSSVAIGDAGFEISDFSFDLEDLEPATKPGKIKGWLVAPNIAEKLAMEGSLTSTPGSLKADLLFTGQGITGSGIAGYLKTIGVEPLLKDGALLAHVKTSLGKTDKGIKASLAIEDVVYSDGQTELAGVDRVKLGNIEFSPSTLSLGVVEIARPRATVTLEKGNAIVAGGIRIKPPAKAAQPPAAPLASTTPATQPAAVAAGNAPDAVAAPAAPAPAAPAPAAEAFAIALGGLKLTDAALQLSDQSAATAVNTTARVNVDLGALLLGRDGPPADLKLTFKADDIVDSVAVNGKVLANPKTQAVMLKIDVAGLRGTALAGYLPAGTAFSLKDGRLTTEIDAGIEQLPAGGMKARLLVNGLDYRDGTAGPSFVKLDQFRIVAPLINPDGGAVTIDQVQLNGFEMDAVRAADGSIGVMGLAVGLPAAKDAAPAVAPVEPAPAVVDVATTKPAVAAATQPTSAPTDVAAAVAKARKAPPLITVNTLDLNVRRIGYIDHSVPDTKPLTVANLRFRLLEKLVMLGKDPAGQPPAKFQLTGKVDPLIGSINVGITTAPFAQQPTVNADVILNGINGEGIFAVAPKLRELIDTADLKDGEFKTKLEATAKVDRRGPMDVDFSKGFDIEALVHHTEFRAIKDGDILLGLDEIRIEDAKFRPVKDDAGKQIATSLRIKSIDLTKPMGQVVRDQEGIRIAGLLVKMPTTPATQPTTGPATEPAVASTQPAQTQPAVAEAPAASQPATAPAVAVVKPAGEIRVDKFTVSGIDFRVIDRSVDPVFVLPLTSLDVDVRDASNMAMYEEDRPIRFSASMNAGKVTVPKKVKGGLIGAVGGVANLIGGAAQQQPATAPAPECEDRELFSQIAAGGKLTLYPKPDGYLKVNVSGFELASLAGFAKQKDIALSYGTFDMPLDLRGDGKGGFVVDTRPAITDLSVTEPAGGPISKYLVLPAALDIAIGAVEAADKSITIPVKGVTVTPDAAGKYSVGGIGAQIQPAISSIFLNAIAAIPAKAVTGVASAIGLDAIFAGQQKPEVPIVLAFPAGYTGLEPAELTKMRALAERMKKEPELTISVKHDLGGGDLSIAEVRANPTTADAAALASSLRQRKIELTQLRGDVAASARTRLAVSVGPDVDNAVDRVRVIDRELSRTEDALDRLYDLMRPGADRQAPRRTRVAALDLGQERLDATRQVLVDAGVPDLVDRLKPAKPAFAPGESTEGGTVTITLVKVKK